MKRPLGIIVLLFSTCLSAQEPTTVLFGQPWLNGHAWRLLDSRGKTLYITAFNEGTGIAIINWLMTGKPKPTTEEFQKQESFYTSDAAFTVDDTLDQLEKLYSSNANLDLPVAHAILLVIYKFRGATPQQLETYMMKLRKMVSEKSSHVAPPIRAR